MATDYAAAVAFLDAHVGQKGAPGLDRVRGLLDVLAHPEEGYPIVHVAGTNGKTSTARMIATLVASHGLASGLFTSPHLDRVEQRYEVSGFPMTAAEFAEAMTILAPIVDLHEERSGHPLGYFELTASLALSWFADRSIDVGVLETGLGGRWDATNAAAAQVAVVTTIDLEHTHLLGDTIAAIAAEKLAILDPGADLVTGDLHEDALSVAGAVAADMEARWFRYGTDYGVEDPVRTDRGWRFGMSGIHAGYDEIELGLRGRHQVANFAVAVAAMEAFLDRSLDEEAVRQAAATVTSPGRMEVLGIEPWLLTDGAHNPAAMEALAASLDEEFPGVRWSLVFGAMRDKDVAAMVRALRGRVGSAHLARAESPRALPADRLAVLVADELGIPASPHQSTAAALAAARGEGGAVLVTGSLYLVGEVRSALGVA